jgi:8-oxo-dGTP pyrophosphatase MutT (NUDIX family)
MDIIIESFGFLHGAAPAAHLTVDLREHFRDPHVSPELRELDATDDRVRDAVLDTPGIRGLVGALGEAVLSYQYAALTSRVGTLRIAVGCAGGRHRAPVVAADLASALNLDLDVSGNVEVQHRDMARPVVERPPAKACDGASVGVLVEDEDGRVLVGVRADGGGVAPIAGHVWDTHTSYEDAAVAEVWEETGLKVTGPLKAVTGGLRLNRCRRGDGPVGRGHIWGVYRTTATGEPRSADGSMRELRYADRWELGALALRTLARVRGTVSDAQWAQAPGLEMVWLRWLQDAGVLELTEAELSEVEEAMCA